MKEMRANHSKKNGRQQKAKNNSNSDKITRKKTRREEKQ